jgi:hypothetical protein
MDGTERPVVWIVKTLGLTAEEAEEFTVSASDAAFLDDAVGAVDVLAQRVRSEAIRAVVRRPVAAFESQTLVEVIMREPDRASALLTTAFDWSGCV